MDWNNINRDRDTSGLGPIEYNQSKVPALIRKHADNVRTKTYGQEVREAQARNAELAGLIASEAVDISNETKGRQDTVETQFNSVQQELTDKDPISAPEIIAARRNFDTLDSRMTKTDNEIDYLKGYSAIYPRRKLQPVMTIIDDDALTSVYDKYKPSVENLKYPVSVAVITGAVDGPDPASMTLTQINELSRTGYFEFVSHTRDHYAGAELTPEIWEEQMIESKKWLKDHSFNDEVLVYPGGYSTAELRRITAKYFNTAINIDDGLGRVNTMPINSLNLYRCYIEKGLERAKLKVDEVVSTGGWLIIGSHSATAGFNIADIEALVNYARSKGVAIENVQNALKYYGNLAQFGDVASGVNDGTIIAADGQVYGKLYNFQRITKDVTNTSHFGDFPPYAFSTKWFSTSGAQAANMPNGLAGLLITDRTGDAASYINQTYKVYKSRREFKRWWDTNTSAWGAWEETTIPNTVVYIPNPHTITNSTSWTSFPPSQIHICDIPSSAATGFPDARGGLLTTNRIASNASFTYQTYEVARSADVYKRYLTTGDVWAAWKKISV